MYQENTKTLVKTENLNELNVIINNANNKLISNNSATVVCPKSNLHSEYVSYIIDNDGNVVMTTIQNELNKETLKNGTASAKLPDKKPANVRTQKFELQNSSNLSTNHGGIQGLIRYGKKHLIIDQHTIIRPRDFKKQLLCTEDIIMDAELAPCTKQQMRHILTGITKLFAYPAHKMPSGDLLRLYVSKCTTKPQPNIETYSDMELTPTLTLTSSELAKIRRLPPQDAGSVQKPNIITSSNVKSESNEDVDNIEITMEAENTEQHIEDNSDCNLAYKADIVKDEDDIEIEESADVIQIDSENDQFVILQEIDTSSLSGNNIGVLLAAAETNESMQYEQLVLCNEADGDNKIFIVPKEGSSILGMETDIMWT